MSTTTNTALPIMCAAPKQGRSGSCNQEVGRAPAGSTFAGFFASISGDFSVLHN
jgi:hypothetical protein